VAVLVALRPGLLCIFMQLGAIDMMAQTPINKGDLQVSAAWCSSVQKCQFGT
jgi:hypothetical protein